MEKVIAARPTVEPAVRTKADRHRPFPDPHLIGDRATADSSLLSAGTGPFRLTARIEF
jgi:hypothetical protein